MQYRIKNCVLPHEKQQAYQLLLEQGLTIDAEVTDTLAVFHDETLIGTGSLYHHVIKMIAVKDEYQGEGVTGLLLAHLIDILKLKGVKKYFLYTKPENQKFFLDYNFSLVYATDEIVMLENKDYTIKEHLIDIKSKLQWIRGSVASIVMNCNPVTLGHMYLIETVANRHENVLIFLVEEDLSIVPFHIRLDLLKKSTKHLKNVQIIPSTPYIISKATFPTYFIKSLDDASRLYMMLDIHIFMQYFIPIFNIDFRYVGNEPLDPMTNAYNQTMQSILKEKLIIIDRKTYNNDVISASLVRKLAREKSFDQLKLYVPKATYQFLTSKKGQRIIQHG